MTQKELKSLIKGVIEESVKEIVTKVVREEMTTLTQGMRLILREELVTENIKIQPAPYVQSQNVNVPYYPTTSEQNTKPQSIKENSDVMAFRKDMMGRMMMEIPASGGNNYSKTPPPSWNETPSNPNTGRSSITDILNQTLHESSHRLRENPYD